MYEYMTWLPRVLRAQGITVHEFPGWASRGLSADNGPFIPTAVVWHHDASKVGPSPNVPAYMVAHFEEAAAQIWVDTKGEWTIVAAGRAPHVGPALPGKPTNYTAIGIETDHTVGERWPKVQMDSLRLGTAAILAHLHRGVNDLEFHKTICDPPGRKQDPAGLNLTTERVYVAREMREIATPTVTLPLNPHEVNVVARGLKALGYKGFSLTNGKWGIGKRRAYAKWQRSLGYKGKDADGKPGPVSLRKLGEQSGKFKVAR
jgi:hypothetical protein